MHGTKNIAANRQMAVTGSWSSGKDSAGGGMIVNIKSDTDGDTGSNPVLPFLVAESLVWSYELYAQDVI